MYLQFFLKNLSLRSAFDELRGDIDIAYSKSGI